MAPDSKINSLGPAAVQQVPSLEPSGSAAGNAQAPIDVEQDRFENSSAPTGHGRSATPPSLRDVAEKLRLAVTEKDAELDRAGIGVRLHPKAEPTATVSVRDILDAEPERRDALLQRYQAFLTAIVGRETSPVATIDAPVELIDGPWSITASGHTVSISRSGKHGVDQSIAIDLEAPTAPSVTVKPASAIAEPARVIGFLLEAFEHLLATGAAPHQVAAGELNPAAAELFMLLLGPDGILNPQSRLDLPASQRFSSPKLICWDLNGTVERGKDSFRPDMRQVTKNLNRMGALSAITTTIAPEGAEALLEKAGIPFNAYFGANEVRSDKGNKHYTGVAAAYGLTPGEAQASLAVIGDSKTDIPRDMPGVVFINNDADTPAEAIQILLHALDQRGNGSFARGLESLVGTGTPADDPRSATLGPMTFDVEWRNGGSDDAPSISPVVHNVNVNLSNLEIEALLSKQPPSDDLDARAVAGLALRFVEEALPAQRLTAVLRSLHGATDRVGVLAAARSRLDRRAAKVDAARKAITELGQWCEDPVAFDDWIAGLRALGAVGGDAVARGMTEFARDFSGINGVAQERAQASLDDYVEALPAFLVKAQRAAERAAPIEGSVKEIKKGKALLKKLEAAAKDPVPDSAKSRQQRLAILKAYAKQPIEGAAALLSTIAENFDNAVVERRDRMSAVFAERVERQHELSAVAADARAAAKHHAALWFEVEAAWQLLADDMD